MPKGVIFWVLMIMWAVFGFYAGYAGNRLVAGGSLLLFILLFLLGWQVFGFVVQ